MNKETKRQTDIVGVLPIPEAPLPLGGSGPGRPE
jgi:hypothetical protein